jgi:hypothetical protein
MKEIKVAMTLHQHLHSLLQKNLWCNSVKVIVILKFFSARSCKHPFWCGSLRRTGLISAITTSILHPIRGATVITVILHLVGCVIGSGNGGSWGWGVSNRRWNGFGISAVVLVYLLFFIGVVEDNHIIITRQPEKSTLEVAKELPDDLLVSRSVGEGVFLPLREIHHREPLGGGLAMLIRWGRWPLG